MERTKVTPLTSFPLIDDISTERIEEDYLYFIELKARELLQLEEQTFKDTMEKMMNNKHRTMQDVLIIGFIAKIMRNFFSEEVEKENSK